jgi:hypothetical protein
VKGIVRSWLESEASGDWVLVLDNADNKLDFFPDNGQGGGLAGYVPRTRKGTVIITTRDFEVAHQLAGPRGVLSKEAMEPSNAEALFKHHYPSGEPFNDEDCTQLLEELRHLPLAISQVAPYLEMNRNMITPSQYLQSLRRTKEDQKQLLSKSVHNPWRADMSSNSETVLTTFGITFRQIQIQSPLTAAILQMISCVDSQSIPHELLATLKGGQDEIILGKAIAKLRNFSLAGKDRRK